MNRRWSPLASLVAVLSLALAACSGGQPSANLLIVDLNRTTTADMTLTELATDSSFVIGVSPLGSYVCSTDTLSSGLYIAKWDSLHFFPLYVRQAERQTVCGSWQEWQRLSFSSAETEACVHVEHLRASYAVSLDSALAWKSLSDVKGRKDLADSVATVKRLFRSEADKLLRQSDTTIAALPLLMSGLYNFQQDSALICKTAGELGRRYPDDTFVRQFRSDLNAHLDTLFKRAHSNQ